MNNLNKEELRDLNEEFWDYAVNAVIFFAIDYEFDCDGELENLRNYFVRPQEDCVNTFIYQLNYLEIDYSKEKQLAEEQLEEIVNNFIKQWGDNYSIEECIEEVNNAYLMMLLSAYHYGSGLSEELGNELGSYEKIKDYIDVYDLIIKIKEKYDCNTK